MVEQGLHALPDTIITELLLRMAIVRAASRRRLTCVHRREGRRFGCGRMCHLSTGALRAERWVLSWRKNFSQELIQSHPLTRRNVR